MPTWRHFLQESSDTKEVAKVVMIDNQERVLFLKRKNDQKFPNKWDLPGGHIKEGESHEDGLRREVEEETNLILGEVSLIKKDGRHIFYKSNEWSGEMFKKKELPEHSGYRWFKLDEIFKMGDKLSPRYLAITKEVV